MKSSISLPLLLLFLCHFLSPSIAEVTKKSGSSPCEKSKVNCTCSYYDKEETFLKINCREAGFYQFPQSSLLPPNVAEIDLELNKLVTLEQLENNANLKRLNFKINSLKKLDNFAFEHTPNLIFIDLSYNELSEIPETVLDSLSELQFLNLSHNILKTIPKNLFRSTRMLSEVNLAYNPIKYISGSQFLNLDKLYSLNLAHNDIFSLPSDIFHGLSSLSDVDLSRNDLDHVPSNALRLVSKLHRLDLSGNPIRVLNEASFRGMSSLRHLALNQMKHLYAIERNVFSEMHYLEKLYVEDNSVLSYVDQFAFAGMFNKSWCALQYFTFRKNHLSHLHEKTLPFCKISDFDLRENPWDCNCHLHWLKECHGDNTNLKGLICAKPGSLRGHSLQQISVEDMVCHTSRDAHFGYVLLFFSSIILLVVVVLVIFRTRIADVLANRKSNGPIYYVRANDAEFR